MIIFICLLILPIKLFMALQSKLTIIFWARVGHSSNVYLVMVLILVSSTSEFSTRWKTFSMQLMSGLRAGTLTITTTTFSILNKLSIMGFDLQAQCFRKTIFHHLANFDLVVDLYCSHINRKLVLISTLCKYIFSPIYLFLKMQIYKHRL